MMMWRGGGSVSGEGEEVVLVVMGRWVWRECWW